MTLRFQWSVLFLGLLLWARPDVYAQAVIDDDNPLGPNQTVGGPGSTHGDTWNVGGTLVVGDNGAGTLTVQQGGDLTSDVSTLGTNGSSGTVTVTGSGSTWTADGNLRVGRGGTGIFNIEDGATVASTQGRVGVLGSQGTTTITGTGSSWTIDNDLIVGNGGTGDLIVEQGGALITGESSVGENNGGSGTGVVTIRDAGSTWDLSDRLRVGIAGTGTVNVENGASVTSTDGQLGVSNNLGTVNVTGVGSTWNVSDELVVGATGAAGGNLNISDGGSVTSQDSIVSEFASSNGAVTISGSDSIWTVSGNIIIGRQEDATITVSDGGTLDTRANNTMGLFNGTGSVVVTGTGSNWTAATNIVAGRSARATITLSDGGVLEITGGNRRLVLGQEAGARGTLNIGSATGEAATAAGTFIGNQVRLTANRDVIVFNHTSTDYTFDAGLFGDGDVLIESGTTTLTGNNSSYSGTNTITGGTLRVTDIDQLDDSSTVLNGGRFLYADTASGSTSALTIGSSGGTIEVSESSATFTVSSELTGTGSLSKDGAGVLRLTGMNDYSGGTTITDGSVQVDDINSLGTGTTTLDGGTLSYSGTTSATYSNLVLSAVGGALEVTESSGTLEVSSDLSGTGILTKQGSGTLVLSGTNSYSGGTVISAGVLQVDDLNRLGTGSTTLNGGSLNYTGTSAVTLADLVLGSADNTLDVSNSVASITVSSDLSGTGSLTKSGAGTLILTGTNTYSGGTTVSSGTLQGDSLNIQGDMSVANGATVAFTQATNGTYSGDLSGSGALTKTGSGILTLSGNNSSYSGIISVNGGGLSISAANQLGTGTTTLNATSLSYTASTNATLSTVVLGTGASTFDVTSAAGALTLSGNLAGAGSLIKTGAGTLVLSGTNTFSGGATVSVGTLQVSQVSQLGTGTTTLDGATLAFSGTGTQSYNALTVGASGGTVEVQNVNRTLQLTNTVTSTGAFTKTGSGSLVFNSSSNSFGAGLTVQQGTLLIGDTTDFNAASVQAGFTIASGGRLGGHGTASGSVTLDGGVIAPGASFGIITLGSLDATGTGGTLEMEFGSDPVSGMTNVDQIQILAGGSVDLNNITLNLVNVMGPTPVKIGDEFVIIDNLSAPGSEPPTGTFSSVNHDMFMLDVNVIYGIPGDGNDVAIQFIRSSNNFNGLADTRNEHSVTLALDTINESGDLFTQLAPMNNAQIKALLDPLAGEINASTRAILLADSRFLRQAVNDRLYKAHSAFAADVDDNTVSRKVGPFEMWGQVYGSWGQFFSDGNARTTGRSVGGVLVGVDATYFDMVQLGVVAGFGRTSIDISSIDASSDSDSYSVGGYASANPIDNVKLRGGVAGTWYNIATDRDVSLFPEETLSSDQFAGSVQVFGELGYTLESTYGNLEPFAGVAYAYLSGPGFNETGGAAALKADGQSNSLTFLTLGTRGEFDLSNYLYGDTSFVGLAAWQYSSADTLDYTQSFIDSGNPFTVASVPIARNVALIETGLESRLAEHIQLNINYYGLLADQTLDHGANARLFVQF
ncbi:Extracellular serine protease precursor [Pseudovibrio sp. Ad13]|uniref:autotransporter outer membrane beta-barrel domain-containing protein n=1 Tax=Pseudovibrio sp. Ad13 TaxID=989396 RepID=UPI0007B1C639|nr:autotransporter outer membrane beta-barrel domain-containing protein [Pseudovibrio sp. Ad13]KZK82328.1 Extracellular serine protease precursor [Pseudovibrio sp. Ad13]